MIMKARINIKKIRSKNSGFTLIETILYFAILSIIILSMSYFIYLVLQTKIKNQTIAEVEQNGNQIMELTLQTIRNSSDINSPAQGTSATSTSLAVPNPGDSPTLFELSGNAIRMKKGPGAYVTLTSSRVNASAVAFSNLSKTGTFGNIKVQFTLNYVNTSGRNEYNYTKTFYGTASLRQ